MRRARDTERALGWPRLTASAVAVCVAALLLAGAAASSSQTSSVAARKHCNVVVKVRGKKKRVRVCKVVKPTPEVADLSVAVTNSVVPVAPGGHLTLHVRVGNAGPAAATEAALVFASGVVFSFDRASTSPGGCSTRDLVEDGALIVSCALGTIRPKTVARATIQLTAGRFLVRKPFFHLVVTSSTRDPHYGNSWIKTYPDLTGCAESYPEVCMPPPPPDLDCADVPFTDFSVFEPDPHRFDGDNDGIGCERSD
jgi:hypothetical protein